MKTIILGMRGDEKSLYHGLGFQLSYERQGASFLPEALALAHFTTGSYGGVHCKNFCYDPMPEAWWVFETLSQNIDVVSVKCFHW